MATIVDEAPRMLTKRPTVARTSDMGIWLAAEIPTLASEPRTEITRPRDVTGLNLELSKWDQGPTMPAVLAQTVKPAKRRVGQIRCIFALIAQAVRVARAPTPRFIDEIRFLI